MSQNELNANFNKTLHHINLSIPPIYQVRHEDKSLVLYVKVKSPVVNKNGKSIPTWHKEHIHRTDTKKNLLIHMEGMMNGFKLVNNFNETMEILKSKPKTDG